MAARARARSAWSSVRRVGLADKRRPRAGGKVGIALAGGGPLGGIYEVGALAALHDCLDGIDFNALDVYVGVSSGSFVASALANGITPREMSAMFIESDGAAEPFDPAMFLRPAYMEYLKRAAALPPIALAIGWRWLSSPLATSMLGSLRRLGRAVPAGLFDGAYIERSLAAVFNRPGRTNDFGKLGRALYIVATDLDSGTAVEFGAKSGVRVPISTAVRASASLPGLFPPVEIAGRHYADGALMKTLHASVALKHGAELVLCINPLVPFDAAEPRSRGRDPERLYDGGLPAILSQAFRTVLYSRLETGMAAYKTAYPGRDLVLFQPNRYDAEMFFTNVFSYSSRRRLAEHAYQKTREELYARRAKLMPVLARHGITLNLAAVRNPALTLVAARATSGTRFERVSRSLAATLDDLERRLRARRAA